MTRRGTVLVTGGAGYIGSHCCKALSEAGYRPVCFDNLSTGHRRFVQWGPLLEGDVQDQERLEAVFRSYDFAAVMHFAAVSAVGESVVDPQKYYSNNVSGTLSLLSTMRQANCSNLIFSSTGAVYGNAGSDPISETDPETARQSIRQVQINDRGDPVRSSPCLWAEFDLLPIFQRQRRRCVRS